MKLSKSEWQIMNALWQKNPATARELMDKLPSGVKWAYTTVKTMLNRLVEKNVLAEYKQGNTSLYKPFNYTTKGAFECIQVASGSGI